MDGGNRHPIGSSQSLNAQQWSSSMAVATEAMRAGVWDCFFFAVQVALVIGVFDIFHFLDNSVNWPFLRVYCLYVDYTIIFIYGFC